MARYQRSTTWRPPRCWRCRPCRYLHLRPRSTNRSNLDRRQPHQDTPTSLAQQYSQPSPSLHLLDIEGFNGGARRGVAAAAGLAALTLWCSSTPSIAQSSSTRCTRGGPPTIASVAPRRVSQRNAPQSKSIVAPPSTVTALKSTTTRRWPALIASTIRRCSAITAPASISPSSTIDGISVTQGDAKVTASTPV